MTFEAAAASQMELVLVDTWNTRDACIATAPVYHIAGGITNRWLFPFALVRQEGEKFQESIETGSWLRPQSIMENNNRSNPGVWGNGEFSKMRRYVWSTDRIMMCEEGFQAIEGITSVAQAWLRLQLYLPQLTQLGEKRHKSNCEKVETRICFHHRIQMNFDDSDDDVFAHVAHDPSASNRLSSLFAEAPRQTASPAATQQQQPTKSKESQVLHYAAVQLYR